MFVCKDTGQEGGCWVVCVCVLVGCVCVGLSVCWVECVGGRAEVCALALPRVLVGVGWLCVCWVECVGGESRGVLREECNRCTLSVLARERGPWERLSSIQKE